MLIREALTAQSSDNEIAAAVASLTSVGKYKDAAEVLLPIFGYADLQLFLDDSELKYALNDAGVTHSELRQIEDAAWEIESKRIQSAIGSDPDVAWLRFLGNAWSSQIEPNDMKDIKWKVYKNYVRLKPPRSISHGAGEIQVTKDEVEGYSNSPGTYDEFKEFLNRRAGGQLAKRKPYRRSPSPYYD